MALNGVIVVDKPQGWTSHDVVARCRKLLGERSIGHLGTLDPMATGVLPLVLGRMTRLSQFYSGSPKCYEGTIRLGTSTDTYDADGEPLGAQQDVQVSLEQLRYVALSFIGPQQQVPPPFSAKKIKGVPAYKLARRKVEIELKPVEVVVHYFAVAELSGRDLSFCCRVSSGTYVRSLAHELGRKLGCGAYLSSLRRTAVGEFEIAQAKTIREIESAAKEDRVAALMVHPRKLLPEMPSVSADEEAISRIRAGRTVNLPELSRSKWVKVFAGQTELICLATRVAGTLFHPKVVLM
jgi:tRNA pseudouridine55 synthase